MHDGIRATASNSTNCLHIPSWRPTKVRLSSAVVCAKLTALQTAANSLVSDLKNLGHNCWMLQATALVKLSVYFKDR